MCCRWLLVALQSAGARCRDCDQCDASQPALKISDAEAKMKTDNLFIVIRVHVLMFSTFIGRMSSMQESEVYKNLDLLYKRIRTLSMNMSTYKYRCTVALVTV